MTACIDPFAPGGTITETQTQFSLVLANALKEARQLQRFVLHLQQLKLDRRAAGIDDENEHDALGTMVQLKARLGWAG
jgi:hypothetical protein